MNNLTNHFQKSGVKLHFFYETDILPKTPLAKGIVSRGKSDGSSFC